MKKIKESMYQPRLYKNMVVKIPDRRFDQYDIQWATSADPSLFPPDSHFNAYKIVGVGRSNERNGRSSMFDVNYEALDYLLQMGYGIDRRFAELRLGGRLKHVNNDFLFETYVSDFNEFVAQSLKWVKKYGIPNYDSIPAEMTIAGRDNQYGQIYVDDIARSALFLYDSFRKVKSGTGKARFDARLDYIMIINGADSSLTTTMADALTASRYFFIMGQQFPIYGNTRLCPSCLVPFTPDDPESKQKYCLNYDCIRKRNNEHVAKSKRKTRLS